MTLPVLFGANVDPLWQPADLPVQHAAAAERLGLDLVTIQDHPYQAAFYDTWTLLTYLAGRIERITFVPTVATLPLRPPAMLAKSAASLDLLTGGRVQLGLGAGAFWDAIVAMGGPRRAPAEAVAALEEAIAVIRAMWSGERSIKVEGAHYRVAGLHRRPTSPASESGSARTGRGCSPSPAPSPMGGCRRTRSSAWTGCPPRSPASTTPRRPRPRPRPPATGLQHLRTDRSRDERAVPRHRRAVDRPVARRARARHERVRVLARR